MLGRYKVREENTRRVWSPLKAGCQGSGSANTFCLPIRECAAIFLLSGAWPSCDQGFAFPFQDHHRCLGGRVESDPLP